MKSWLRPQAPPPSNPDGRRQVFLVSFSALVPERWTQVQRGTAMGDMAMAILQVQVTAALPLAMAQGLVGHHLVMAQVLVGHPLVMAQGPVAHPLAMAQGLVGLPLAMAQGTHTLVHITEEVD
ncbi:uncharacterized protein LOC116538664 [Sapajus apella]|uniref:Uncharacterized protein LOC116538664 n=1 Tax=Sapajus apella TaxID=9515 RepID=A0A6J3GG75_SAPAP|nr:uncharacterized protein LOC116538664 [Sapajus apella]